MSRILTSLFLTAACALTVGVKAAPPAEDFLNRPASGVSALLASVRADDAARQRFSRFFHLTDAQVVPFLKSEIVAGTIPKDGFYTVTCIHPSGLFYPTKQFLHRGERVFLRHDGKPLLQWGTGDPLTPFVTATEYVHVPSAPPRVIEKTAPTTSPSVVIPAQP